MRLQVFNVGGIYPEVWGHNSSDVWWAGYWPPTEQATLNAVWVHTTCLPVSTDEIQRFQLALHTYQLNAIFSWNKRFFCLKVWGKFVLDWPERAVHKRSGHLPNLPLVNMGSGRECRTRPALQFYLHGLTAYRTVSNANVHQLACCLVAAFFFYRCGKSQWLQNS